MLPADGERSGEHEIATHTADTEAIELPRNQKDVLGLEVGISTAPDHQLPIYGSGVAIPYPPEADGGHPAVIGPEQLEGPQRGRHLDDRRRVEQLVAALARDHRAVRGLGVEEQLLPVSGLIGGGDNGKGREQGGGDASEHGSR